MVACWPANVVPGAELLRRRVACVQDGARWLRPCGLCLLLLMPACGICCGCNWAALRGALLGRLNVQVVGAHHDCAEPCSRASHVLGEHVMRCVDCTGRTQLAKQHGNVRQATHRRHLMRCRRPHGFVMASTGSGRNNTWAHNHLSSLHCRIVLDAEASESM